jgi:hypothetical protein
MKVLAIQGIEIRWEELELKVGDWESQILSLTRVSVVT